MLRNYALSAITTICLLLSGTHQAQAVLGGFEVADGYATPFPMDVWMYDAGQTGGSFTPIQYNTGRWVEIYGSSNAGGDAQYISQHGFGGGGANSPPFALAVRSIATSPDGSYDMTLSYALGADDLGVSPATTLQSATIEFDLCPGSTWLSTNTYDTVFNDVPAFSLSIGGTNASPGATIGFTDNDPGNSLRNRIFHMNGASYVSQNLLWTYRFDHMQIDLDFITQTYDLYWTPDFNLSTTAFDAGNAPVLIASGASLTNSITNLDYLYFRAHTDPGNGVITGGLEKSFLDNFQFSVQPVPEPSTGMLLVLGAGLLVGIVRRRAGR